MGVHVTIDALYCCRQWKVSCFPPWLCVRGGQLLLAAVPWLLRKLISYAPLPSLSTYSLEQTRVFQASITLLLNTTSMGQKCPILSKSVANVVWALQVVQCKKQQGKGCTSPFLHTQYGYGGSTQPLLCKQTLCVSLNFNTNGRYRLGAITNLVPLKM